MQPSPMVTVHSMRYARRLPVLSGLECLFAAGPQCSWRSGKLSKVARSQSPFYRIGEASCYRHRHEANRSLLAACLRNAMKVKSVAKTVKQAIPGRNAYVISAIFSAVLRMVVTNQ